MQHLLDALGALAKNHSQDPGWITLVERLEQFLRTGEARWLLASQSWWERNGLFRLASALPMPAQWSTEDRRLIEWLTHDCNYLDPNQPNTALSQAIEQLLGREEPDDDVYAAFRAEFTRLGIEESRILRFTVVEIGILARGGRLTSAGRYVAAQSTEQLAEELPHLGGDVADFWTVWLQVDLAGAQASAEAILERGEQNKIHRPYGTSPWELLLQAAPAAQEELCARAFATLEPARIQFRLGCELMKLSPGRYDDAVWRTAEAALPEVEDARVAAELIEWMLQRHASEALELASTFVSSQGQAHSWMDSKQIAVLAKAVELQGRAALPVVRAATTCDDREVRHRAFQEFTQYDEAGDDDEIAQLLQKELASPSFEDVMPLLPVVPTWREGRLLPQLWDLLSHKSKTVREATVALLASHDPAATEHATGLLTAKKADTRSAAAAILGKVGSPAAVATLRAAQASEESDSVLDALRAALAAHTGAEDAEAPASDALSNLASVRATIRKGTVKAKLPADWADSTKLPALHFADGAQLDGDEIRFLLFRQARAKNIEPEAEAKPIFAVLDRARSGDFALAVLQSFLSSGAEAGDRWALTIAGLLGDERVVPVLTHQIDEWAEKGRGKLAEYAVQALALQASDAALLAVDALSIRYRTKVKNIGKAAAEAFAKTAEARGLSPAELGDRVIPWLGFVPGEPRLLAWGETKLELSIGLDFKPTFRDLTKNKRISSLPGSAPAEIKAKLKGLTATLKEAVKAQLLRLEGLMVQQHRWPAARWAELFLQHPLLIPFAARLVWGSYGESGALVRTFRALEDRTLTTAADEPAEVPVESSVGMVHPLELTAEDRQAWLGHLADYEVVPPFAQLERSVIAPAPEELQTKMFLHFDQVELNAMTFRGRAEKRGWLRGSVVDAGGIWYYYKPFHTADVDVFLVVDGMYIGVDMYSSMTMGRFYFVRHSSVRIGSYTYDEPTDEKDERILRGEEVPAIVFSEALGDLRHIAGQNAPAPAHP